MLKFKNEKGFSLLGNALAGIVILILVIVAIFMIHDDKKETIKNEIKTVNNTENVSK